MEKEEDTSGARGGPVPGDGVCGHPGVDASPDHEPSSLESAPPEEDCGNLTSKLGFEEDLCELDPADPMGDGSNTSAGRSAPPGRLGRRDVSGPGLEESLNHQPDWVKTLAELVRQARQSRACRPRPLLGRPPDPGAPDAKSARRVEG